MGQNAVHVMERKSQVVRLREWVAYALREEMDAGGYSAKELSRLVREHTVYRLDYRTIQNAMAGTCTLDTYEALCAFFGWDFSDRTLERVHQTTRLASLEKEIADERAIISGKEAHLSRLRAATAARAAASRGVLRLVGEEERVWPS